jgi:hypothetical protein
MATIDTSIYGLIQQPRQEGPLDQYAKAMTVKGLVNQGELQDLQRTQLVDSMDRQKRVRDLLAGGGTAEQVMAIDPDTGLKMQMHALETKKTQAELRKTEIETFGSATKQLRDLTAAVNDDAGMAMLAERAKVLFGPDMAAKMNIPTRFDPNWKQQQIVTADALLKQIEDEKQRTFTAGENEKNRGIQKAGQTETRRHNLAMEGRPEWDSERGVFVTRPTMGGSVMAQGAPAAGPASAPASSPAAPASGVIAPANLPKSKDQIKAEKAEQDVQRTLNTYIEARNGLLTGLAGTETGAIAGRITPFTAAQQTAEGGVAAMAPVLKQLFRSAGEGVFTDRDQALLLDMVPTRKDEPEARKAKIENIDRIVAAKLGMQVPAFQATPAGSPKPAGGIKFLGFE